MNKVIRDFVYHKGGEMLFEEYSCNFLIAKELETEFSDFLNEFPAEYEYQIEKVMGDQILVTVTFKKGD